MKRALVLSGGGAKGAFQYGALEYIRENVAPEQDTDVFFQIISGISVGALNGVMLAMNRFDALGQLWRSLRREDIYMGSLGKFRMLGRMMLGRDSLLDNAPLQQIIDEQVTLGAINCRRCDFRFGAVSLVSGQYHLFHAHDFDDDTQFRKGILAATAIPTLWPPVERIVTKSGRAYTQMVDGGIRNVSPLGDIIDDDPDEVVIINCNAQEFNPYRDETDDMLKIARRALTEITVNELLIQDIREFLHINDIVAQLPAGTTVKRRDGRAYKKYKSIVIEPDHDLGDALDFDRSTLDRYAREGYAAAQRTYETITQQEIAVQ